MSVAEADAVPSDDGSTDESSSDEGLSSADDVEEDGRSGEVSTEDGASNSVSSGGESDSEDEDAGDKSADDPPNEANTEPASAAGDPGSRVEAERAGDDVQGSGAYKNEMCVL